MQLVGEADLVVQVTLDLEEKLPASHAISDVDRLRALLSFRCVKHEHERLLLEVLVRLELEVRDVHILLL